MTTHESADCIDLITKLWPKVEMNPEVAVVWGMSFGRSTVAQVIAALRDMKANSTRWPTPALLKAKLAAGREATGERVEMSRWDVFRTQNNLPLSEWPDDRCALAYAKWEFEKFAATYGTESKAPANAWAIWQDLAWRQGYRDAAPLPGEYDTDPTGKAYAESLREKARAA